MSDTFQATVLVRDDTKGKDEIEVNRYFCFCFSFLSGSESFDVMLLLYTLT
jgi:plasmid maintenance system killer protein